MARGLRWAITVAWIFVSGCYLAHPLEEDGDPVAQGSGPWLVYSVESDARAVAVRATQLDGLRTVTVDEAAGFARGEWSPASPRLALVYALVEEERGISVVRFEPEGPVIERRVEIGDDFVRHLSWSPSGRYLAYGTQRGHEVFVLDVETSRDPVHLVTGPGVALEWSASDVLAISVGGDDRYLGIARADEGFVVRRVALPPMIHTPTLDRASDGWSHDGRLLLFYAKDPRLGGSPGSTGAKRLFVTTERAEAATLVSPAVNDVHPSASHARWSPDGRRVVYDDTDLAPGGHTFVRARYVCDLECEEPMRLGPNLIPYTWADPGRIVAIENEGRVTRGVSLDIGSSEVTRSELFTIARSSLRAVFSRDGRHVVISMAGGRRDGVMLWSPGAGAPREVHTVERLFLFGQGAWSPDGAHFVFVGRSGDSLSAYELSVAGARRG